LTSFDARGLDVLKSPTAFRDQSVSEWGLHRPVRLHLPGARYASSGLRGVRPAIWRRTSISDGPGDQVL